MAEIEIEAFRAGTPASKGITAAHIAEAASAFKPDAHRAPVVMGHPADDQSAPAFGEISGARADGNSLFFTIKNLAKEAVDGVRQSRILNRSAAFWHPAHPSNPNPGKFSIRHLGLLGGSPPAIPNLAPLRFAADEAEADGGHVIADGEPGAAVIFAAPDVPPAIDIAGIAAAVAAILKPTTPAPEKKEFAVATEAELQAREDAIKAREDAAAAKETAFAAAAKTAYEGANTAFAAKLVTDGKFPAGHKDDLVAILNSLPMDTQLTFSGDKKEAPADALKRLLDSATPVINFSAITPTGAPNFTAQSDGETEALRKANERAAAAWQGK